MIREADANETSGELGVALPGSRVGVSQLRMPVEDVGAVDRVLQVGASRIGSR